MGIAIASDLYLCRDCRRQFRDNPQLGYSAEVKALCVTMSLNGMGFRAIERVTGINHNSVLNWVRLAAAAIPQENYEIPETAQLDELETFVGQKKTRFGGRTVVNTKHPGILKFVVGDHSLETFKPLWQIVMGWASFLYITDGYKVYPCLIEDGDHLVSKTAMTRVEGENCRLRHYKRPIASQDVVLFQIGSDVDHLSSTAHLLSQASSAPGIYLNHSLLGNAGSLCEITTGSD